MWDVFITIAFAFTISVAMEETTLAQVRATGCRGGGRLKTGVGEGGALGHRRRLQLR